MMFHPLTDSNTRMIKLTEDQMKLIAHLISLVDPSKINFTPKTVPFIDGTIIEVEALQEMFDADYSEFDREDTVHNFCL